MTTVLSSVLLRTECKERIRLLGVAARWAKMHLTAPKPFQARRTHCKSRLGCATCKRRRIKVSYPSHLSSIFYHTGFKSLACPDTCILMTMGDPCAEEATWSLAPGMTALIVYSAMRHGLYVPTVSTIRSIVRLPPK